MEQLIVLTPEVGQKISLLWLKICLYHVSLEISCRMYGTAWASYSFAIIWLWFVLLLPKLRSFILVDKLAKVMCGVKWFKIEKDKPFCFCSHMFVFLLQVHHHISFSLWCCQGDAKGCALSKQLNNQEERLTQSSGEFEHFLHTSLSAAGICHSAERGGPVRFEKLTTETEKGNDDLGWTEQACLTRSCDSCLSVHANHGFSFFRDQMEPGEEQDEAQEDFQQGIPHK